jgi:TolA-binding protein
MTTATRRGIVSRRRALVAVAFGGMVVTQGCVATKKVVRTLLDNMQLMQQNADEVLQALQRQQRLMLDTLRSSMALTLDTRGQTSHRFEELNGMIESSKALNGQILEVARQLLAGMSALEARLQKLESQPQQSASPSPAGGSGGVTAAQYYQSGMQALNSGSYGSARTYFGAAINANHDDPIAADARYQIAESYVREENYGKAYETFELVPSEWPNSARAPEALYRAATVARDAGDNAKARKYYNMVIRLYKESPLAKQARTALDKLPK